MKEKWLSAQKNCKLRSQDCFSQFRCKLYDGRDLCTIENCQIFKFAEALLPKPEPEPIKLPTLEEFWYKGVHAIVEVCWRDRPQIAEKKVAFWYNDSQKLTVKKCEYINDTLVYHLEDY